MSSAAPADSDALVAQLAGLTGLQPSEAAQYLNAANGDIEQAAALFFEGSGPAGAGQEDEHEPDVVAPTPSAPQQQTGGGRTLGGDYVPGPSTSGSSTPSRQKQPAQRGLRTLKDLQSGSSHAGHGHGGNGDDDDEGHQHDFFTGGEKSGLAVENPANRTPQDHINNILKRARENAQRPGGDDDDDERASSHFRGAGVTLGGDDAPSQHIPDPHAARAQPAPRVHRELHLWRDGFSVDDGPLYRYDDPANARTLEMINTGHAPIHILNVEQGQEVDVNVHPHKEEDYKKPKKKYVPFSGSGQRLGSPTPGAAAVAPPPPAAPSSTTAGSSASGAAQQQQPRVQIDDAVPIITLQVRLGDGTRLQSRFNTTHTVGDVYGFVDRASPASLQRGYVLMTTFPSKELSDKAQVLGDMAEFKRGGVVVQKWT